jgi:transposase
MIITPAVLSLPADLLVSSVAIVTNQLTIAVIASSETAACPLCSTPSARVHSHYQRTVADVPCCGRRVVLQLHVRRFRCALSSCPRRIFTERLPLLVRPWAQITERLRQALIAIGLATSGQQGARLATHLGITTSASTINRGILALPPPSSPFPCHVVGIDDWSYRRGHRYGTILVDLVGRRVLDLLPNRQVAAVAQWIRQHPEVDTISRDRGEIYADGVSQGNPSIVQIADRWHLLKNLGDALERFVVRCHLSALWRSVQAEEPVPMDPEPLMIPDIPVPMPSLKRQQRFTAIHDLLAEGKSLRAIARHLGLRRNTVRRYARMTTLQPRPILRASKVDPYRAYLYRRWSEGCTLASQLFAEVQQLGYRGSYSQIRDCVARLRQHPSGVPIPPARRSPRQIRWLLAQTSDQLTATERHQRLALLAASPETLTMFASYHTFWALVRLQRVRELERWLANAEHSGIEELGAFANGVRRDYSAVAQAISSPWSQGQVEGQITRVKLVKRQMYGRAGFALLRQRVLHRI